MRGEDHETILPKRIASVLVFAWAALILCPSSPAQQSVRGTINGRVTADQGQVRAFRVAAHNLDQRLWYIVFTKNGQYTVPQALPGLYQLTVDEPGYASPKLPVYLLPGDTKTVDLALKKQGQAGTTGGGDSNEEGPPTRASAKVEYVTSMEDVYPPGPERDLLKQNCTGCHSDTLTAMHYSKEGFLRGIERMTETGPSSFPNVLALGRTIFSTSQKEQLAEYLAKNFGPGMAARRLRVDPVTLDEDVASKAIYVSYDVPAGMPLAADQGPKVGAPMIDGEIPLRPGPAAGARTQLQAAAISPTDGTIWFTARHWNSILGLDPKELDPAKRWRNYPVKGEWVAVSGVTVDSKGKVYWSELDGGMLGELDPASGKQIRYVIPQKGVGVGIMADKNDNIDFALIWGALFGRLDAKTRMIHTYPTPTPDNGIYGLAVDQQGNMWGAGWQKGTISKWDAETGTVTEYPVPNSWGQIRRIGVDSKGVVWASEYNTGYLARLDPSTGKMTEYKIPVNGANPYEAWADKDDNAWTADQAHSALLKLDPKTGKFTFYPMPQPYQSVPKMEVASDNTLWFGTRGMPVTVGVHFYPNGYTADAPPLP
jgi:virginiamycin B lyase